MTLAFNNTIPINGDGMIATLIAQFLNTVMVPTVTET